MIQHAAIVGACFVVLVLADVARSAPLQKILIDSTQNVRVEQWSASSGEVTPSCPVNWSVRKDILHGGKQEGVDVILIDNGKMQVVLCSTRGMGLLSVKCGDLRLGWDSPVKETVDPRYVNLQSRGGLGWLEGFNEFMCRCGMEWSGHPGTDKFINNVGDEATMDLTLHGRLANLPASEVVVTVERDAPYRIHIRGRVVERMFYGPKLELLTELTIEPGATAFRLSDKVTNHGDAEQEFQMLYHTNFGTPLLEEGATFVGAVERITPFNAHAAEGLSTYDRYAGPKLGFIEQVYKIKPAADSDGRTMALLKNARGDRAASVSFNVKQLPCLTLWKNTNALAEGYVTGIEPGTSFPHNRRIERLHGRVPKLAGGASRQFDIDYAIHLGDAAVKDAVDRIRSIQGDRKPMVDPEPEKND